MILVIIESLAVDSSTMIPSDFGSGAGAGRMAFDGGGRRCDGFGAIFRDMKSK